ncbi:MAG TPA: hypothetical protein V6D47_01610 [Oscillatoriaceae cyanobacterium]
MPLTAIPFKAPPPFELPPVITNEIGALSFEQAAQHALELLLESGCGDAFLTVRLDSGKLVPGPGLGAGPDADQALAETGAALTGGATVNFLDEAIAANQPLLLMGELAADETVAFPDAFKRYLLRGAQRAPIGFLYVFPLDDTAGQARGALAIHRGLTAGPLNHDQPAIAHALARALGERLD